MFKTTSSESAGSIPFFNDWIKDQTDEYIELLNGTMIEPLIIKAVQSGKGYLLNFDHTFMIFVWKNSSIGKLIKRMIKDECGNLLLLLFVMGKKTLTYDIGVDDEVEVAMTEDKHEEDIYTCEITAGEKPPIAPRENRKSICSIPLLEPKPPVKFTTTKKATPKPSKRSDGGDA